MIPKNISHLIVSEAIFLFQLWSIDFLVSVDRIAHWKIASSFGQ